MARIKILSLHFGIRLITFNLILFGGSSCAKFLGAFNAPEAALELAEEKEDPKPILWLDASTIEASDLEAGNQVASWRDLSGNGHVLAGTTSPDSSVYGNLEKPTLSTLNSFAVVDFDPTRALLVDPPANALSAETDVANSTSQFLQVDLGTTLSHSNNTFFLVMSMRDCPLGSCLFLDNHQPFGLTVTDSRNVLGYSQVEVVEWNPDDIYFNTGGFSVMSGPGEKGDFYNLDPAVSVYSEIASSNNMSIGSGTPDPNCEGTGSQRFPFPFLSLGGLSGEGNWMFLDYCVSDVNGAHHIMGDGQLHLLTVQFNGAQTRVWVDGVSLTNNLQGKISGYLHQNVGERDLKGLSLGGMYQVQSGGNNHRLTPTQYFPLDGSIAELQLFDEMNDGLLQKTQCELSEKYALGVSGC